MGEVRRETRTRTDLNGSVRYAFGTRRDVVVIDISEHGCRIFDRFSGLQAGEWVRVRINGMGPFEADVRWAKRGYVGLRFETPLYAPVLEHLAKAKRAEIEPFDPECPSSVRTVS